MPRLASILNAMLETQLRRQAWPPPPFDFGHSYSVSSLSIANPGVIRNRSRAT
ncbi:MAG: hypothetical protein IT359_17580 [Gemmatimonadaceae bacterium]|nr:hypothetical protein [Gemmatimonadaceae bacterium]